MPYALLLEIGLYLVRSYIKSSESKQDDKILKIIQDGSKYLAPKPNNELSHSLSSVINTLEMRKTQRAK